MADWSVTFSLRGFCLGKKRKTVSEIAEVIIIDYLGINFTVFPFIKCRGSFFSR